MARMKLPLVAGLVVATGLAAYVAMGGLAGDAPVAGAGLADTTHVVARSDFDVTLTESGNLVAKDSQKLSTGADHSG